MTTVLTDHRANFEELAALCVKECHDVDAFLAHRKGLKEMAATREFYGEYASAARIMLDAAVAGIDRAYERNRADWQANLDGLIEATIVTPDDISPDNGPSLLLTYQSLENAKSGGFKEEAFGDLMDEAKRVCDTGIEVVSKALQQIALMVLDPERVPKDTKAPIDALERALAHGRSLKFSLDTFGSEEALAEAKRRYPLWLAKQEELIAKKKAELVSRIDAQVECGIDHRERESAKNALEEASLTTEARAARLARAHDVVHPLFKLAERLTEIAVMDDVNSIGSIDAEGLHDCVQQAQALVLRVKGSLN